MVALALLACGAFGRDALRLTRGVTACLLPALSFLFALRRLPSRDGSRPRPANFTPARTHASTCAALPSSHSAADLVDGDGVSLIGRDRRDGSRVGRQFPWPVIGSRTACTHATRTAFHMTGLLCELFLSLPLPFVPGVLLSHSLTWPHTLFELSHSLTHLLPFIHHSSILV